jgi:hypothetical protein
MNKKKNKAQILEDSLSEAINPKPRTNIQANTKNLLQNYRDDSPLDLKLSDGGGAITLPSTIENASRPQNKSVDGNTVSELPSTVVEFSRPQDNIAPSTQKTVDVLPSTRRDSPASETDKIAAVDVLPSTSKIVDVHNKNLKPSAKGDRHNRNLARFDNRIESGLKRKIDVFCAEHGFTQRELVEQSAVHFMEMWTAKISGIVDGKTAHDDRLKMILFKSTPHIINLYRAYNFENKWKLKDDELGQKYNSVDLSLIELGIIQTQFNASFKKINSFEYYKNEIDSYIEQGLAAATVQMLLQHYRIKWSQATKREIDLSFLEEGSEK